MEKMTFYRDDESNFECGFRRPTMHVKEKVLDLSLKFMAEQKKIDEEFPGMGEVKKIVAKQQMGLQLTENELNIMVETLNDSEKAYVFTEYSIRMQNITEDSNRKKLQQFLQPRHLADTDKENLESNSDSTFWKNQNLKDINDALIFFRDNHSIG